MGPVYLLFQELGLPYAILSSLAVAFCVTLNVRVARRFMFAAVAVPPVAYLLFASLVAFQRYQFSDAVTRVAKGTVWVIAGVSVPTLVLAGIVILLAAKFRSQTR